MNILNSGLTKETKQKYFPQFPCSLQESLQNDYEKKIYKIKQDWKEQVLAVDVCTIRCLVSCEVTRDQYVLDWRMPPCNLPASYSDLSPAMRKGRRDDISARRCSAFYFFPWCLAPCLFPIIHLDSLSKRLWDNLWYPKGTLKVYLEIPLIASN